MNILLITAFLGTLWRKPVLNTPPPPPPPPQIKIEVVKSYMGELTAYTSREEETDDTPTIGADGTEVHWGVVATNAYSFGTKMRFPDVFGDEIFVVTDRMNSRYKHRIDIWFPAYELADDFGLQNTRVEIVRVEKPPEVAIK